MLLLCIVSHILIWRLFLLYFQPPVLKRISHLGCLTTRFDTLEQPLVLVQTACRNIGLELGIDVYLAINCAAHELMDYVSHSQLTVLMDFKVMSLKLLIIISIAITSRGSNPSISILHNICNQNKVPAPIYLALNSQTYVVCMVQTQQKCYWMVSGRKQVAERPLNILFTPLRTEQQSSVVASLHDSVGTKGQPLPHMGKLKLSFI